jgi:hypothetical protein
MLVKKTAYRILAGKPEKKKQLGKHRIGGIIILNL